MTPLPFVRTTFARVTAAASLAAILAGTIGAPAIANPRLLAMTTIAGMPAQASPGVLSASNERRLEAELVSFNQVPSVLSKAAGVFRAVINPNGTISYQLSYANLSSGVVQAHIHFGQSRTNGGVAAFLCGGAKPACPAAGTVSGTITAADVSTLPANNPDSVIPQGIQPGDLAGFLVAIRSGSTYVNVHTMKFPNGEIRGAVERR